MLSRDICKKCVKSLLHYVDSHVPEDEKIIACFVDEDTIMHLTLVSDPPTHCPYKFEHAVSVGRS
jgi:hypothetical protein